MYLDLEFENFDIWDPMGGPMARIHGSNSWVDLWVARGGRAGGWAGGRWGGGALRGAGATAAGAAPARGPLKCVAHPTAVGHSRRSPSS